MGKCKRYRYVDDYCKQHGYEPYQVYAVLQKNEKMSERLIVDDNGERKLPEVVLKEIGNILKIRAEGTNRKRRTAQNSASVAVADEINSLTWRNEQLTKEVRRLKCENEHLKEILTDKNKKK